MRTNPRTIIPSLALVILTLTLAACSSNPTNRWAQGAIALTQAEETILVMHELGRIDDETLVSLEPSIVGAKASLDKAKTYLPEGGPLFDVIWSGFTEYLIELQAVETDQ